MKCAEIFVFCQFEQLVDFFVQETGLFLPKLYQGQSQFFAEFSHWLSRSGTKIQRPFKSFIHPEPLLGIAFPNAYDVLANYVSPTSSLKKEISILDLLHKFGLGEEHLTQPVSTLSGGELLQLSFAKAAAQINRATAMVACNPLFWLNPCRHKLWEQLAFSYNSAGIPIKIASMQGDSVFCPSEHNSSPGKVSSFPFVLKVFNASVHFPEFQFPVYHKESFIHYQFSAQPEQCHSPMLITGDNGVGKSVLARVLAGVIPLAGGLIECQSESGSNSVRLLFQESTSQLFAQTPAQHRKSVFSCATEYMETAEILCKTLVAEIIPALEKDSEDQKGQNSLLEAKISIIAERLAASPALLILDEPGLGLSSEDTIKLVFFSTRLAHSRKTAVAIISHQPQWLEFASSRLSLANAGDSRVLMTYKKNDET